MDYCNRTGTFPVHLNKILQYLLWTERVSYFTFILKGFIYMSTPFFFFLLFRHLQKLRVPFYLFFWLFVFLCSVPGFGPTPFGGPPGHMGPMQPGKNQVDSFTWESFVLFVVHLIVRQFAWMFLSPPSPILIFSFSPFLLSPVGSFLLPRFQGWSHPIKMLRMDLGPPLCSRTHRHHPRTATILWRARWASPTGQLHMIPLRGEVDYQIITPALSLDPRRRLPHHPMAMNPTTATQSKILWL